MAEHAEMLGSLLDSWNDVAEADIDLPEIKAENSKKGFLKTLFKRS